VSRATTLLTTGYGAVLEYLAVDSGTAGPTTLFVHGLGGGIADTRPLGSAVAGRRVFVHLRGHGRSTAPAGPWGYEELAVDVAAVADEVGATRALGVSLGAGALCRLVAERPDRFERLVFFLPAVLHRPRDGASRQRMAALVTASVTGDRALATELVTAEVPAGFRGTPAAAAFVAQRVATLLNPYLGAGLADLPSAVAVPDAAALHAVTAPALVLACQGDPAHPPAVAEELAGALGHATLHRYPEPGVLWTDRADLRRRISGFLNG
jgi:3-oxoadipate enol-lactonase